MGGCEGKKITRDLINFLQQTPENQIIFSSNPENFKKNFIMNKNKLVKLGITTIDQLALNQKALNMIMTEVEAEQFVLAYNYRNLQQKEPLSGSSTGTNEYTYALNLQNRLNKGRNVLVIGESKSGKTTLINSLVNSLLIDYADRYRYHVAEYDYVGNIQECDLDIKNIQIKFLEVIGYGQEIEQNNNMMQLIYRHLEQNQIEIDCILICRKFAYQPLNTREKQIIFHLAEIFRQSYIQKCFLVNTNYDLGNSTQIYDLLRTGLISINNIYDRMPEPKILFVNSSITPFEGNAGASRFQTVKSIRDEINRLIDTNNDRITIIGLEAFKYRRQTEIKMKQIKNQIKRDLVELLPCLENYFAIREIQENSDDLFYESTISWSTLNEDKRIRTNNQLLSLILDDIILPDDILARIELHQSQFLQSMDIDRQKKKKKEITYKEQFIYLRNQLTLDKTNRLQTIVSSADDYINEQSFFLQQTYLHQTMTREQLIGTNMNSQLIQYLQLDPGLEIEELKKEFEEIKQQLLLPNINLVATQIIGI